MNIPREYQKDIDRVIEILREEGCSEVYLFGSLGGDAPLHVKSDIDIAVRGIPQQRFFEVYGRLLSSLEHIIDLIDLDSPSPFTRILLEKGGLHRVA